MGLFSFGKKRQEGFEFSIDETFSLNNSNSIVVTGKLKQGRFVPGTMAVCLDRSGNPLFRCRIEGIEQGRRILKIASADVKGPDGSRYGLKLGGVKREQVPEDGCLVTETEELLEELKERVSEAVSAPESASQPQKAEERREEEVGPLGFEREEELSILLQGDNLSEKLLRGLTVQESIFLLCRLQKNNRLAPVPHYQEKGQLLYMTILEKLKDSETLYLLLDEGSHLPFILGDTVDVYSTKELAEQAASVYEKEYHHLTVKEVEKDDSSLPGKRGIFEWLFYLGMGRILVDNGSYQLIVKLEDIVQDPAEFVSEDPVPVCNPKLRFAMADFLQETRWHVTYAEREENIRAKREHMTEKLKKAKFLVPMKVEGEELHQGENELHFSENTSMTFPKIQNNKGQYFIPLFTDWTEFERVYKKEEWSVTIFTLADAVRAAEDEGLVINPLTENLVIGQESEKEDQAE